MERDGEGGRRRELGLMYGEVFLCFVRSGMKDVVG